MSEDSIVDIIQDLRGVEAHSVLRNALVESHIDVDVRSAAMTADLEESILIGVRETEVGEVLWIVVLQCVPEL